jgi:hypothetical protein
MNDNALGELYGALAQARMEFGAIVKDKTAKMGQYTYQYADLGTVIDATASTLAKYGLVIIQEPEMINDNGKAIVLVHGCIAHKGGAVHPLRALPMPLAGGTAQNVGSAITYARRYQLLAALNLTADEDDDGESASQPPKQAQNAPRPNNPAPKTSATQGVASTPVEKPDSDAPADEELEAISTWRGPVDAQMWAVKEGYCANDFEARNSFKKVVDQQFGGRMTTGNQHQVLLAFLRHQLEKVPA